MENSTRLRDFLDTTSRLIVSPTVEKYCILKKRGHAQRPIRNFCQTEKWLQKQEKKAWGNQQAYELAHNA